MARFVPKAWMMVLALATGAVLLSADPVLAWPQPESGVIAGEDLAIRPVAAAVHVWRETLGVIAALYEGVASLVR
jgi:hypothetical protein